MNLSEMMNRSEGGEHRDVQLLRSPHLVATDHPNGYRRQAGFSPTQINNAGHHHFPAADGTTYKHIAPQEQSEGTNMNQGLSRSNASSLSPQRYSLFDDSMRRPPGGWHDVSSDSISTTSMDVTRNSWQPTAQASQYVFMKAKDHNTTSMDVALKTEAHSPHKMNGAYLPPSSYASTSTYPVDQNITATFRNIFENGVSIPTEIRAAVDRITHGGPQTGTKVAAKKVLDPDHPDAKLSKLSTRTVTGENVSEENIVDGYVQFVFAHDAMYASDDTDSIIYLKKKIMATPKTQDLTYSAWDIYALVMKLHIQELKNWSQLVGELGHSDISTRPQFAQRIKRWMSKYKIDRYFDYLLGNPYTYDGPSSKFSGCLTMGTNHRRKAVSKSDADDVDLSTADGDGDSTSSPNKRRKLTDRHEKHEYDEADIPAVDDGEEGHATGEESSIRIGGSSDVEEDEGRVVVAGSRKRARGALPTNLISNRPKSSPGFVADDEGQSGYSEVEHDTDENGDSDEDEEEDDEENEEEEEDEEGDDEEEEVEEEEDGFVEGDHSKPSRKSAKQPGDVEDLDEEDELNSSASSAGSPRWTPSALDLETLGTSENQATPDKAPPSSDRPFSRNSGLPTSPKPSDALEKPTASHLPTLKPSTEGMDNNHIDSSSPSSKALDHGEINKLQGDHGKQTPSSIRELMPLPESTSSSSEPICCVQCGHSQPQATQLRQEVQSLRQMLNSLYDQFDKQALQHRQSFEQMARRVKQKDAEIERFEAWRRQVVDTFLSGPPPPNQ